MTLDQIQAYLDNRVEKYGESESSRIMQLMLTRQKLLLEELKPACVGQSKSAVDRYNRRMHLYKKAKTVLNWR